MMQATPEESWQRTERVQAVVDRLFQWRAGREQAPLTNMGYLYDLYEGAFKPNQALDIWNTLMRKTHFDTLADMDATQELANTITHALREADKTYVERIVRDIMPREHEHIFDREMSTLWELRRDVGDYMPWFVYLMAFVVKVGATRARMDVSRVRLGWNGQADADADVLDSLDELARLYITYHEMAERLTVSHV